MSSLVVASAATSFAIGLPRFVISIGSLDRDSSPMTFKTVFLEAACSHGFHSSIMTSAKELCS